MDWNGKPYHSLDYEMKRRFGTKVYKIALEGGMTCPNRDGPIPIPMPLFPICASFLLQLFFIRKSGLSPLLPALIVFRRRFWICWKN